MQHLLLKIVRMRICEKQKAVGTEVSRYVRPPRIRCRDPSLSSTRNRIATCSQALRSRGHTRVIHRRATRNTSLITFELSIRVSFPRGYTLLSVTGMESVESWIFFFFLVFFFCFLFVERAGVQMTSDRARVFNTVTIGRVRVEL